MSSSLEGGIKLKLSCFLLAFMCASSNTLGFDGFFHAIASSSIENIVSLNPPWIIEGFPLPRYILFHYIIYITSIFGLLPFYFVISLINGYILFKINSALDFNNILLILVFLFFILYNYIFISALGFSISWILLWYLYKDKRYSFIYLVIGSISHPVGLLIGLIISIFKIDIKSIFSIILLLILAIYLQTTFGLDFEYKIYQDRVLNIDLITIINRLTDKRLEIFFLVIACLTVKIFLRFRFSNLKVSFLRLIFIGALSANIYSIEAQLRTGGLWWALFAAPFDSYGGDLIAGKQNIVMGSFFSPKLFEKKVISDHFYYRDSQLDSLH